MHRTITQGSVRKRRVTGKAGLLAVSLGVLLALGAGQSAQATTLFATSLEGSQIDRVDTNTEVVTPIFSTASEPDSLIFDNSGRIIYTEPLAGQVRLFDPNTSVDSLIANVNAPNDLTLEPGGHSILVPDFAGGGINRIDLTTDAVTSLTSGLDHPEGITYDNSGRLFVNANQQVLQLDPTTGAILHSSGSIGRLDGLAFDSFTGKLFSDDLQTSVIYQLDPANLGGISSFSTGVSGPDGLESDGKGTLFVVGRGNSHIFADDLTTNTLTQNAFVFGLDDLAPASGLGAPPPPPTSTVPEPCSLTLLALGGLPLLRRRRAA